MDSKTALVQALLEGQRAWDSLSAEEQALFDNDQELTDLQAIAERSSQLVVPGFDNNETAAWQRLEGQLGLVAEDDEPVLVPRGRLIPLNRWAWVAVAASVVLVAFTVLWLTQNSQPTLYATGKAELNKVPLPDGSIATLSADSELAFYADNWASNRRVSLKGEAFFEVKPGHTFTVAAGPVTVEVLGTSFNVTNRPNHTEVLCATGKVQVFNNKKAAVTLNAGQGTRASNKGTLNAAYTTDVAQVGAWVQGRFFYNDVPLPVVAAELERQFNVTIHVSNIESRRYTGNFTTNSLDEALELVFGAMSLRYNLENERTVTVSE